MNCQIGCMYFRVRALWLTIVSCLYRREGRGAEERREEGRGDSHGGRKYTNTGQFSCLVKVVARDSPPHLGCVDELVVCRKHSHSIVHVCLRPKAHGQSDPKLTQIGRGQVRLDQTQAHLVCVCVRVCMWVYVCVYCVCVCINGNRTSKMLTAPFRSISQNSLAS